MTPQQMPMPALPERRQENLAWSFQELLTVGERLRSHRQQVGDANAFREQIWEAAKVAQADALKRGYNSDDIELALFAVIAYMDESILVIHAPAFSDWARMPLQQQRYGHDIAGEVFFQNLQKILTRSETHELADLLEVYYLCLLLGFAGRYSVGGQDPASAQRFRRAFATVGAAQ
jgi:type VI secretion system protein ImpK